MNQAGALRRQVDSSAWRRVCLAAAAGKPGAGLNTAEIACGMAFA
ncbi:MAG: hypothetical protein QM739_08855 [Propionivibrio sp.]